jgi:hypothetical protein
LDSRAGVGGFANMVGWGCDIGEAKYTSIYGFGRGVRSGIDSPQRKNRPTGQRRRPAVHTRSSRCVQPRGLATELKAVFFFLFLFLFLQQQTVS